jgi:hypothetical protein
MIHKEQIYQYIESPGTIDDKSIGKINQLLETYPFFHTGHMLFLKALYKTGHWKYKSQIKRSSAFIIDKKRLYQLLFEEEAEEIREPEMKEQHSESSKKDVDTHVEKTQTALYDTNDEELIFMLDDAGQENTFQKTIEIKAEQNQTSEMQEENGLLVLEDTPPEISGENEKTEPQKNGHAKQKYKSNDLIDQFIQNEPGRIRADENNTSKNEDLSKPSAKEDDGFYTETLGNIYIQQGYYKKAIHVFQKLSLKYPKKNDYFADKIKELNQIINKSKKQ